jgi:hypothetical protein
MATKLILTNRTALAGKYGADLGPIDAAVQKLIAADAARGLDSVYLAVDDPAATQQAGGAAVTDATDQQQNKRAIDSLYHAHMPDYLMLLGSCDVIPHQDLENPLHDAAGSDFDPDATIASDLPYACDRPYSSAVSDFGQITRAVARLPDVTGGSDPAYLAGVLGTAAQAVTRPMASYKGYLGVSTQNWVTSTQQSLQLIFRDNADLQVAPGSNGPQWTDQQLSALVHFFNCHGNPRDSRFYGQLGTLESPSHDAAYVAGKLREGTVAAMECCYGAQLYDPRGGQAPMANTYLASGAYGYLGSTDVAYGDQFATSCADNLSAMFLGNILNGASLGRALLQARQSYLQSCGSASEPHNAKTLAQFILLGDPSIQPVVAGDSLAPLAEGGTPAPGTHLGSKSGPILSQMRVQRRRELYTRGVQMKAQHVFVTKRRAKKPSRGLRDTLQSLAQERGLRETRTISYSMPREPREARLAPERLRQMAPWPDGVHAIFGRYGEEREGRAGVRLLMVRTREGRVLSYSELHKK